MDDSQLVLKLIRICWPLEAEAVGPAYLREIANGRTDFGAVEGAAHIDFLEILKALAEGATVIRTAIEIGRIIRNSENSVSEEQVKKDLVEKREVPKTIGEHRLELISQEVASAMKPPNDHI